MQGCGSTLAKASRETLIEVSGDGELENDLEGSKRPL